MPGYLSTSFNPNEAAAASDLASNASEAASKAIVYASAASDAASAAMIKAAAASSKIAARSSAWESGGGSGNLKSEGNWTTATLYHLHDILKGADYLFYHCTTQHTSGASTEPGVGADWETVWELFGGAKVEEKPTGDGDFLVGSQGALKSQLNFEGANNSTTFTDLMGKTWTVSGTAKIVTEKYRYGSACGYFDGNGAQISTPACPDLAFGSEDFHIKFSMWPETDGEGRMGGMNDDVEANSPIRFIRVSVDRKLDVKICHSLGASYMESATVIPSNAWTDVVLSRSGGTFSLLINGTVEATVVAEGAVLVATTLPFRIGQDDTGWDPYQGWIDGFRVVKESYDPAKTYVPARIWARKTLAETKTVLGMDAFWPIGSVFISVVSTNPATLLGIGTWAAIAAGKVLVGRDAADVNFDVAEETGGAKTVTPSAHVGTNVSAHAGCSVADHTLVASKQGSATGNVVTTKTHTVTQASNHTITQPSTHAAMSVVQPYFVVYMWKRTA
jgi:hypothetical protein